MTLFFCNHFNVELLTELQQLLDDLRQKTSEKEKLALLRQTEAFQTFSLNHYPHFSALFSTLSEREKVAVAATIAIKQGDRLFADAMDKPAPPKVWRPLITFLSTLDHFYAPIGGIIGYQRLFLQLLHNFHFPQQMTLPPNIHWLCPPHWDLTKEDVSTQAVQWGINNLPQSAELYPIGGAGDRLQLVDESTGALLPAATLPFVGRSLLEGLIRDLQGREFLHYQLLGRQIITPIVLMTSQEKDNDNYIRNLCASCNWFGRPPESIRLCCQPLVPIITEEGNWALSEPLCPRAKPGGHGVIWKLAQEEGIFLWLQKLNRRKIIVRQINNPIAGVDGGLLALGGIGCHEDKAFGTATCQRFAHLAEGMVVLVESYDKQGFSYHLQNIEYTSWKQAADSHSPLLTASDTFPANSNILFADIVAIEEALKKNSLPGLLINMKSGGDDPISTTATGPLRMGRLESTMQNIGEEIVDISLHSLSEQELLGLKSFTTWNKREKTISVAKNGYKPGEQLLETPQRAFYDLLQQRYDLLKNYCQFAVPTLPEETDYLNEGPPFLFDYHPALGPLYSIIGQKIRGGKIRAGSELQLEISALLIERLILEGCLLIIAENPLGSADEKGLIQYGVKQGRCILRDVTVRNEGFDTRCHQGLWKAVVMRKEPLRIDIHGNGEFIAEGVVFDGGRQIDVADGCRVRAYMDKGVVKLCSEPIQFCSWRWHYRFNDSGAVDLIFRDHV